MIFPKTIASKIGFDQVSEAALIHCQSSQGKKHFEKVKFTSNPELVKLWLEQTAELQEIISKGEMSVSIELDFDLQYAAAMAEGFFYELETIIQIRDTLDVLKTVITYLNTNEAVYSNVHRLFKSVDIDFGLIEEIDRIIGADGEIKPTASKKLQSLYSDITKAQRNIIKSSNSIFSSAKDNGLLGDTELGIKNGRVVLPVLSEHKRKVKGVLIDQSGTGKISYIEPIELVGLNNDLSELEIKKRQEIIVILRTITSKIVVYLDDFKRGIQKLSVLDFIRAKARLALDWKCVIPSLGNFTEVYEAKHPLLEVRLSKSSENIVPLDYKFTDEQRLIVISGPNAGGKSVALKTVGLLQYMLQSGFLVPCLSTSVFKVYENIFIDIGDDQSIESDLSTYSSHLKAAKHIINFSDAETLVLMDEIGTGTDPMFGGPMAEAILETIHSKNAQGIITTHFSNIKSKADKLKYAVNAAMLFDVDKLVPLYKLQVGQPGSSFVYEVASNIGLNKKIIKRAKQLTNTKQYDLDVLLAEVQTKQEQLDIEREAISRRVNNAELIETEYKALRKQLDNQKKEIINQAKKEANAIIAGANKDIEKAIREIKENNASKEKTKRIRESLEAKKDEAVAISEPIVKSDIKVGDQVQIEGSSTVGEVIEIKKNNVTLSVGSLTTKTKLNKVGKIGVKTAAKVKKYISTKSYNDKQSTFRPEKDLRGMRTYDALSEIDQWMDSAIILGIRKLRILHGKGNGILRMEIRRHLKGHPNVDKISYERVDLGGEGISIIDLK